MALSNKTEEVSRLRDDSQRNIVENSYKQQEIAMNCNFKIKE